MKKLIFVAILVLAATMLGCQGSCGRLFLRRLPDRVRRLRRGMELNRRCWESAVMVW